MRSRHLLALVTCAAFTAGCGGSDIEVRAYTDGEPTWLCPVEDRLTSVSDQPEPDKATTLQQAIDAAQGDQSIRSGPIESDNYIVMEILDENGRIPASYRFTRWTYADGSRGGWFWDEKQECPPTVTE